MLQNLFPEAEAEDVWKKISAILEALHLPAYQFTCSASIGEKKKKWRPRLCSREPSCQDEASQNRYDAVHTNWEKLLAVWDHLWPGL